MNKRKLKIAYLKALQRGNKEQAASIKKELDGKVVVISSFTDLIKNHHRKDVVLCQADGKEPFDNLLKQYGYDNTSNQTA